MGRPAGKWPHYAEWHRCEAIALLDDIILLATQIQDAIAHGRLLEGAILLGTIIRKAGEGKRALEQAKNGER